MNQKSKSPFKIALNKFYHNKIAMISLFFLITVIIISILAH